MDDDDSMILKEEIDPNYEPTQDEILEYAEYVGLELPEDEDLLYLVREGLKAPLPEPWKPCKTKDNEVYYFNFQTGESDWTHPCDKLYKAKIAELKAAKRKRQHASKKNPALQKQPDPIKMMQKLKPTSKPPLAAPIESGETKELSRRKVSLKEALDKELKQIKRESEESVQEYDRNLEIAFERDRNKKDKEHLRQLAELDAKCKKESQQTLELAKARLIQERQNQVQALAAPKHQLLTSHELSKKLLKKLHDEKEALIRREELVLSTQLEELGTELDHFVQKTQWDLKELEESQTRMQKKKTRTLEDLHDSQRRELKALETDLSRALESLRGDMSSSDQSTLEQLSEKLDAQVQAELQQVRANLDDRLEAERLRTVGTTQKSAAARRQANQEFFKQKKKRHKATLQSRMDLEVDTYRRSQENKLRNEVDLARATFSKYSSTKANHLEKELERQLYDLRKEANELSLELTRKERLAQQAEPLPQNSERMSHLEAEIDTLKQLIGRPPVRDRLVQEREEIKATQLRLQREREIWRTELQRYKDNPSEELKQHLAEMKRVIEDGIAEHNHRVRLYREAEEDVYNEPQLVREERPRWTYHCKEPWEVYNQHIYRRQVGKWSKQRDRAKNVIERHGLWLNNVRDELSKLRPVEGFQRVTF